MSHKKDRKAYGDMCVPGTTYIDYKNLPLLRKYVSIHGRIKPRYYTNVPLVLQKRLARGIKNARHMALLPFVK
jgi:small subunit ribosomal protein S18